MSSEGNYDHESYERWIEKYPPVEQRLKTWTYPARIPTEVKYETLPVTGYIEGALRQLRNDEKLRQVREMFQGVTEGFRELCKTPAFANLQNLAAAWRILSKQEFTPAEFKRFWDGLKEPERINYIRSLIG